jgi:general secretion pathway protein A
MTRPAHDYLRHWGLVEPPFSIEPNPRFAYERADHQEGLARILFGLTQLGGLVLITGEIGCGKTMLAETLQAMLSGGGYRVVSVANPPRTGAALLGALLDSAGDPASGGSVARLSGRLRAQLAVAADNGERIVLAVDEAQRLDARALDELRMLTNTGSGGSAPAVLLGQPELSTKIARYPQIAQRIVVRYHLQPMGAEEVEGYIAHRTRIAGSPRRLFTRRASTAVHEETNGIPRLVNLLCANALFVAAARNEEQIGADTIRDLAEDRRRSEDLADGGTS